MEQQLDGNLIALDKFLGLTDAAEANFDMNLVIYGEQAHDNCVARVLKERTDAVLDVLADDLYAALAHDCPAFRQAVASGDRVAGLLILDACDRVAGGLVTTEDLDREIDRLRSQEYTGE